MNRTLYLIFASLIIASVACSTLSGGEPSATPLPPTDLPAPTRTPEPTVDRTATAEVVATEEMAQLQELVAPDLELAGYSLDEGQLGYAASEDKALTTNQFNSFTYDNLDSSHPSFANFVLGLDVQWDSETGIAGCEIAFRAEEDIEQGQHIRFRTLRLSGFPGWVVWLINFNEIQANLTAGGVQSSSAIKLASGSTNHYVLVADGTSFVVYANGERIGAGTMPARVSEGQILFSAWQESGLTTCTFSNIWVWELPDSQ